MASTMKLSLTLVLLSGLVIFGDIGADAVTDCSLVRCRQGGYITCDNYPGQRLDGCACVCAPSDGKGCMLHLDDHSTNRCSKTN